MSDVTYMQQIMISAGQTPLSGTVTTETDLTINPADILTVNDGYNEDLYQRFNLAANQLNFVFCMGTVALARLLIIKPDSNDINISFTNANGTSQNMVFKADRLSVVHMEFTAMTASNLNAVLLKGYYFIAGT